MRARSAKAPCERFASKRRLLRSVPKSLNAARSRASVQRPATAPKVWTLTVEIAIYGSTPLRYHGCTPNAQAFWSLTGRPFLLPREVRHGHIHAPRQRADAFRISRAPVTDGRSSRRPASIASAGTSSRRPQPALLVRLSGRHLQSGQQTRRRCRCRTVWNHAKRRHQPGRVCAGGRL